MTDPDLHDDAYALLAALDRAQSHLGLALDPKLDAIQTQVWLHIIRAKRQIEELVPELHIPWYREPDVDQE